MKKSFPLKSARHAEARVLDLIKHDVRKYVKRERNKPIPADFDVWDFACKVGADPQSAQSTSLNEISAAIDRVAESGATVVYVEVLANPAKRNSATMASSPSDRASP